MTVRHTLTISLLFLLVGATGCAGKRGATQPSANSDTRVISMVQRAQAANPDAGPKDAPVAQVIFFQMDVYRLAVPFGTFSGNEEFWKRMDEDCVDPATRDILDKNGIRVGQAPQSELKFFQTFMDDKPLMKRLSTLAPEARKIELEMKEDLATQTIARYDSKNVLSMRDYDRSSNVINMSFEPAPRKPGFVRLTLCPVVRSHRKRFEFTPLNNENEIQYVEPELLYDLNLRTDIPGDRFLIVMPSTHADTSTSVGAAFLTKRGHTDRQEEILLIIPHPVVMSDSPISSK